MIKAHDAIHTARELLGTPYDEMDCMALIRAVIRRSPGGVTDYRCEGTNWLWRSIGNSGKYRHLTWQQESTEGAHAGHLAFKRSGDDIHHVGLVTDVGTVIHSSSVIGRAAETDLDGSWDLLGQHRYIAVADEETVRREEAGATGGVSAGEPSGNARITIIDSAGNRFEPVGDWRTLIGSLD